MTIEFQPPIFLVLLKYFINFATDLVQKHVFEYQTIIKNIEHEINDQKSFANCSCQLPT